MNFLKIFLPIFLLITSQSLWSMEKDKKPKENQNVIQPIDDIHELTSFFLEWTEKYPEAVKYVRNFFKEQSNEKPKMSELVEIELAWGSFISSMDCLECDSYCANKIEEFVKHLKNSHKAKIYKAIKTTKGFKIAYKIPKSPQ